jgi:hypothetical protein
LRLYLPLCCTLYMSKLAYGTIFRIAGGFGNNFYRIVTGGYLKAGTRFLKRRLLEVLVSAFL